jgi:hypothetical protein
MGSAVLVRRDALSVAKHRENITVVKKLLQKQEYESMYMGLCSEEPLTQPRNPIMGQMTNLQLRILFHHLCMEHKAGTLILCFTEYFKLTTH